MRKKLLIMMFIFLFILTGCSMFERVKERKNIEKEVKTIMLDYLQNNYNIDNVDNVSAEYTSGGPVGSDSKFVGIVTGSFKKDSQIYQIACDYYEKKCYDSFSYIKKINPILTNYIKNVLDNYSVNNIIKPDYVIVNDKYGLYTYIEDDSYGFFNNYDKVDTYEEILNYYNFWSVNIIYNSSNKIIEDNISAFEKLHREMECMVLVNVYNNGIVNEYFVDDSEYGFDYYLNESVNTGDLTLYWHVKEILRSDYKKIEQGDFEVTIVNNNSYFDKTIKSRDNEYVLYSQNILNVKDMSDNEDNHVLYLKFNKNVCDSNSVIVYKDKNGEYEIENFYNDFKKVFFETGLNETKKFAIYCEK